MPEIEGYILAGGASSRMGRDKARLKLGGKTFVERAAFALSAVAPESITLVGDADYQSSEIKLPNDSTIRLRVISDVSIEKQTAVVNRPRASIVGLYTALLRAETDWLAVLACDLPFASGELFERLVVLLEYAEAGIKNYDAVAPIQPDGRAQPLCALYQRAACLSVVEETLAGGDWSLQNVLASLKTLYVSYDEIADLENAEHFFFNANTPEDYEKAQQIEHLKTAE